MHVKDLQLLASTGCGDGEHAVGLRLRVSCCALMMTFWPMIGGLRSGHSIVMMCSSHNGGLWQAYYTSIGVTAPDDLQLRRIFTALLSMKLADFDDAIKPLGECTPCLLTLLTPL